MNETPESTVCATLYLSGVSQQRFVFVWGVRKKYEFKWNDAHQKLVREYTSPAIFTAEETDIRSNTKNQYAVCTLMGSPHPVTCAKDALATLIAANRSVGIPARRAALVDIVERAQAAIAVIDTPPPDEETPAPVPPVVEVPPPAASLDKGIAPEFQKAWQDAATGVPVDLPPVPVDGEPARPLAINARHSHAELMQALMADVREVAKKLEISLMRPAGAPLGGPKSRAELVIDILAAEQRAAA